MHTFVILLGYLHSSQSYPIHLNLISSLICLKQLYGFIYTRNTVQRLSSCLLTPHRIWTLWTSSSTHVTFIMPRHKDLCQYLEHANFFLPTSPVFTKHKIISRGWAEATGYICNTTLAICSNL